MTDQASVASSHPAPDQPKIPLYRNRWLNAAVVLVGLLVAPIVLIYTIIILWTGPYYLLGKSPPKPVGAGWRIVMTLICVGAIVWSYGGMIARSQTVSCTSPHVISLVKEYAKQLNSALVTYDDIQLTAIRTIDNDRPNGGVACLSRMINAKLYDGSTNQADVIYTADPTDAGDQIIVKLRFK